MIENKEKVQIFNDAYEKMADALYRHIVLRINNQEKAEDIVHDVFLKFWKEIHRNDVVYVKAWLYTSARNTIIDYYRKKKSLSLDSLLDDGFDPTEKGDTDSVMAQSEISLLKSHLSTLSDSDKELLIMRYVDGMELSEIADIHESSVNAISVKIHRAATKIKHFYE